MNHASFDEQMRARARQDDMRIRGDVEQRLVYALRRSAAGTPEKRRWKLILAVEIAMALALLMLLVRPADDITCVGMLPQATNLPAMIPVTQGTVDGQPEIFADITFTGDTVQLHARMTNAKDDDIWLIDCQAALDGADRQPARRLIWLEPGAEYRQEYAWQGMQTDAAQVRWTFTGYRVTAHTLHWMDGQSFPGDEDYEEDQSLLRDAFAAEALILHPGDWQSGQAGEMRLVLPDDQPQDPLSYYIEKGMLTEGCSADETLTAGRLP